MNRFIPIAAILALAGCAGQTPATVTAYLTAAAPTLLQLAAANSTTVQNAVNKGALFCSSPTFGKVVAVASASGGIVSVVNATAGQDVQTASNTVLSLCQSIDAAATPVVPPANPAAVPVVQSPTAPATAALTS